MQDAAIGFVNQLRAGDRVIVAAFDRRVQILAEATSDRGVLREAIGRRLGGGAAAADASASLDHNFKILKNYPKYWIIAGRRPLLNRLVVSLHRLRV